MDGATEVRALDLADLSSVRAFAAAGTARWTSSSTTPASWPSPRGRTADGFELQIGTNHLGPFALTNLLLAHISDRVVTVSSAAHRVGTIDLDDLDGERDYSRWRAYAQSKLANLLFTLELQRRLEQGGSRVTAHAAHPGWAATKLQGHRASRLERIVLSTGNLLLAQSDTMGALPTLYAATQELIGASYSGPRGMQEVRGHPGVAARSPAAADADMARALWERSEELTGVRFGLAPAGV